MAAASSSPEQIADAAYALGCQDGRAGIAARAVARYLNISASAVNYHFQNVVGLISAVSRLAQDAHEGELRKQLLKAEQLPHAFGSMSGFVAGLVVALATSLRDCTLLRLELEPPSSTSHSLTHPFWAEAAGIFGQARHAAIWEAFFEGALQLAVLDRDAVTLTMWVARACQRLEARLDRRADKPALSSEPEREAGDPGFSTDALAPRALQIVEAAASLLMRGEAMTHRSIAKEAGVPLGSTTYFFETKEDIMLAASRALLAQTRKSENDWASQGLDEPFDPDGSPKGSHVGLRQLTIAAARDPMLAPLALQMRSERGRSSYDFLIRAGVEEADRLDGLIWSLCHGGVERIVMRLPPAQRPASFNQRMAKIGKAIFNFGT